MSAQERQRQLNLIDMHAMPHEALVSFVKDAREESKQMQNFSQMYSDSATRVLDLMKTKNLINRLDVKTIDLKPVTLPYTIGVDGSNQHYQTTDGDILYFFSATRITFHPGKQVSSDNVKLQTSIQRFNGAIEEHAATAAELSMVGMETKEIVAAANEKTVDEPGLLFLDGPIVEPPNSTDQQNITNRVAAIKTAFDKNLIPIGIVKGIYSTFFIDKYSKEFTAVSADEQQFKNLRADKNFAIQVLTRFLENSEDVGYTKPFKFSDVKNMDKYANGANKYINAGVDIITFLLENGFQGNPLRVDVAISTDQKINVDKFTEKIVEYIAQWSAPGRHVPIPVSLAHDRCNIGQGAANILYSEFISHSKTGDLLQDITAHKAAEEIH